MIVEGHKLHCHSPLLILQFFEFLPVKLIRVTTVCQGELTFKRAGGGVRQVTLPEPTAPTTATSSPCLMLILISCSVEGPSAAHLKLPFCTFTAIPDSFLCSTACGSVMEE